MAYILLWIEGPMQSWGSASRFARRETEAFPTLSGILGMICCARVVSDGQETWLSNWANSEMYVDSFNNERSEILNDFHMVGSAYDDGDPWETLMIPRTSEGKKAVGGGTKITTRAYLQDSAFSVILSSNEIDLNAIADALSNPVWPIYLGRKCCAPTDLVYRGIFSTFEEARAAGFNIANAKNREIDFHVRPALPDEPDGIILNDVPKCLGTQKIYGQRQVIVEKL